MRVVSRSSYCLGVLVVSAISVAPAQAVLVYHAALPASLPTATRTIIPSSAGIYNGAPIGDWVAQDGLFSAVAIGPHAFLTAGHFSTGSTLMLGGVTYTKNADYSDPNMTGSDLRVITVNETIPAANIAPLYTTSDETSNATAAIFGRGAPSGNTITTGQTFNGWQVPNVPLDGQLSYGLDTIDFTYDATATNHYIGWNFDPAKGSPTSLTNGDSGGAVFLLKNGIWELAGINYGISSPYATDAAGDNSSEDTIVNGAGLYFEDDDGTYQPATGPGYSLASRVSSEAAWISAYVPEPASLGLIAVAGLVTLRRRPR